MALSEYDIEINGMPTTVQLTDKEAERLGDRAVKTKQASADANKAAAEELDAATKKANARPVEVATVQTSPATPTK